MIKNETRHSRTKIDSFLSEYIFYSLTHLLEGATTLSLTTITLTEHTVIGSIATLSIEDILRNVMLNVAWFIVMLCDVMLIVDVINVDTECNNALRWVSLYWVSLKCECWFCVITLLGITMTVVMLSVLMLRILIVRFRCTECHYAECSYTEFMLCWVSLYWFW